MILYEYQCNSCGLEFESLSTLKDCDKHLPPCSQCGSRDTVKVIATGGIQRDEPVWLDSAVDVLIPDGAKPITSRCEFNRYLREHNIAQK